MIMISNFIFSFLASLGFACIFNIKGKKLIYASLGGSIAWLSYLICKTNNHSTVFSFFIGSIAGSIYSEIMARVEKTPVTLMVICAMIPLVPGGGMYYTMQKVIEGDVSGALNTGFTTLSVAGAIALGMVMVSSMTRLIYKFREKISINIKSKKNITE
ncbi:threonine/serine exporter family protein [Clostridium sp. L74]|uniref:threonine/serine exporter family protein n=1 Tax=Clostridium sp. L74 TaxID=1560217 RepID=UPI0006AB7CFD|nr:threonine/serine exporter family protein [Clostridium sp. L74]KOR25833.1 membrane protein [Clostridium sp. L74]